MSGDVVASALAGLGPMLMQTQRKPVDKYAARRQFGDALLMQGAQATPLRGGVAEGLARAGQAVLGGYLANSAETEQLADESAKSQSLMDAIAKSQTTGPNGQVDINLNPVAAALAKTNPTVAAYLVAMDALARRQQGQATDRARILLGAGDPPPDGVPPTAPGSIPGGPLPPPGYSGGGAGPITPNNPGNMIDGRGGFQTFDTPDAGVAATIKNFQSYPAKYNGGRPMSIMDIAARWASADDGRNPMLRGNDPAAWARNVAAASGLPPDRPIDVSDPRVALALVRGIHVAEKGPRAAFSPDVYMRGLEMVRGQPQAAAPPQQPPMAPPGPAMPPPASVAAAPPVEGAGLPVDDSGESVVRLPRTARVPAGGLGDNGDDDLRKAYGLLNSNNPANQALGMEFLKSAQQKRAAYDVRAYQRSTTPPARVLQDGVSVPVEGGPDDPRTIEDKARAGAAGSGAVEYFEREGRRIERNKATGAEKYVAPPDEWVQAERSGRPGQLNKKDGAFKYDDAAFNEGQGKAAGFADRQLYSQRQLDVLENMGLSGRGAFLEHVPLVGNYAQHPDYQRYVQARDNFIAAQLRKESGAVISDKEYADAYRMYMPRPGDTAAVLRQKKEVRDLLVQGMARDAGPAYKPPTLRNPEPPSGQMPTPRDAAPAMRDGLPVIDSPEKARTLPPGTEFMTPPTPEHPNGRRMRVPAAPPQGGR